MPEKIFFCRRWFCRFGMDLAVLVAMALEVDQAHRLFNLVRMSSGSNRWCIRCRKMLVWPGLLQSIGKNPSQH
jgi:hypothetical protein